MVPVGDSIARTELMINGDEARIRNGFLQGRNKAEDLSEMIWLFRNFRNVVFFENAISAWKKGDALIGQLSLLGNNIHDKMAAARLDPSERSQLIEKINENTTALTELEVKFSETLGSAARRFNSYLFVANVFMTVLILGSTGVYAALMLKRLRRTNEDLMVTNREMDKLVYSASHDLKAPISSMKGLIDLTAREQDPVMIRTYLDMMLNSLNKQEQFIKDILNFSRNKSTRILKESVSLVSIVEQAVAQHSYMPEAASIRIDRELGLDVIASDPLRLTIVMNNILSNAIRYSDPAKERKQIGVRTFKRGQHGVIEVTDNGIGIDKDHLNRIFELFFVADHDNKGSGLGLYIVKETVSKLRGTVRVESERGEGTKFTIVLPLD